MQQYSRFLITVLGALLVLAPGAFAKGKAKHVGRITTRRSTAPRPRKIKAVNPYKKSVKPYHNPVR